MVEKNIYLVKKLNPWMYEELLALSQHGSYTLILLQSGTRYSHTVFLEQLETLKASGVQVLVKPFKKTSILSILSFLWLGIEYIGFYRNKKSMAYGLRGIWHYVHLDKNVFTKSAQVHAQFATEASIVAYLLKRKFSSSISYSFTVHAYDIFFPNAWLRVLYKWSTYCITISNFNKAYLKNTYGMTDEKLLLSRLGVNKPVGEPEHIKKGEILHIGFLSWFVEKKGIFLLLEAVKSLVDQKAKVHLHLAGGGQLEAEVKAFIQDKQLTDHVSLCGIINGKEKDAFFKQLDLFVLPSIPVKNDMDGIPVVLMEAVSYGIPIITTAVSGVPEICINEQNGLLIESKDVEAIQNAIARFMTDKSLFDKCKKGALDMFAMYNLDKNITEKKQLIFPF